MDQNLFGQLLINFKLVSDEQLERCIDLQKRQEPPKLLGEILIEQGLIDQKQLNTILSVQKKKMATSQTQQMQAEAMVRERLQNAGLPEFLRIARELGASDLYITSNVRPMVRQHGKLIDLPAEARDLEECKQLIMPHMTKEQIDEYYNEKCAEFSLELQGIGRYRASIFRHLRGMAAVFRVIADQVWSPVPRARANRRRSPR